MYIFLLIISKNDKFATIWLNVDKSGILQLYECESHFKVKNCFLSITFKLSER